MTIPRTKQLHPEAVQEIFESVLIAVTDELNQHDIYYEETKDKLTVIDTVTSNTLFTIKLEME